MIRILKVDFVIIKTLFDPYMTQKYYYKSGFITGPGCDFSCQNVTPFTAVRFSQALDAAYKAGVDSRGPLVPPPTLPNPSRAPETMRRRKELRAKHEDKLSFAIAKTLYDNGTVSGSRLRRHITNGSDIIIKLLHQMEKTGLIDRQFRGKKRIGWQLSDYGRKHFEKWCEFHPELLEGFTE